MEELKRLVNKAVEEKPDFIMEEITDCSHFHKGIENGLLRFTRESFFRSHSVVNIYEINGTESSEFVNQTWLALLSKAVEFPSCKANLRSLFNINYHLSGIKKDITLTRVGENLAVSSGCHYKIAVAKAIMHSTGRDIYYGVDVEEHILDYTLLESLKILKRYFYDVGLYKDDEQSKIIPRVFSRRQSLKEGIGWIAERRVPIVQLLNTTTQEKLELKSLKDILDVIAEVRSGPLLRCFRANRYAKFLR